MGFDKMTPEEIAQYYTEQLAENLISMYGDSTASKKINDKTHFEILKVGKYIDKNFPESILIIDELGKINVPEAQMSYIKFSIAFGVNIKDAFSRLRKMYLECEKKYKRLSILTDEGKRNSGVKHLIRDIIWRTNKYLCYNIPNVDQKNIKYYDKEFLKKELTVLDKKMN